MFNILIPNIQVGKDKYFFDFAELIFTFHDLYLHFKITDTMKILGDWQCLLGKCDMMIPDTFVDFSVKVSGFSNSFPKHKFLISQMLMNRDNAFTQEVENVKISKKFIQLANLTILPMPDRKLQKV